MRSTRHCPSIAIACVAACVVLAACSRGESRNASHDASRDAAHLHYVATGQNGEKFYVDTTTIRTNGDERSFTLVAIEPAPKSSYGATYDRTTTDDRVTCAGSTFVLGGLRGFHGDSVVFDNPGENPLPMQPGGPFEAVHRYVCGR